MDPPGTTDGGGGEGGGGGERTGGGKALRIAIRCSVTIFLSLTASFVFSFLFGLVALAIGAFSASKPVSVASTCRIVSSSVDLRSSKVCELGLVNYRAKHVFYTLDKTRFRCRDDYYWASIFEVEYKEYFSGQMLHAVAEAPKEALPHDCRPDFGFAWLTKMKFKVNETYSCRYTLGSHKAEIYPDNLFDCQAKEPSTSEMVRRMFFLYRRSYAVDEGNSGWKMAYTVAGIVSGMLAAMCVAILIKSLNVLALALAKRWVARKHQITVSAARFRRVCLIVAYFSAMCWLTLQYGRMIGLEQLILDSYLRERTV